VTLSRCSMCVIAASVILFTGCNRSPYSPKRPSTVATDATYIQGPDGKGVWQTCQYIADHDECKVWTVGGTLLYSGVFVSYDGNGPALAGDLKIAQQGNPEVVLLKNGRYLIPISADQRDAATRYLDFLIGKTKSFDSVGKQ
jgi:hypothetical protein